MTTLPCIKATIGEIGYYQATMNARDLISLSRVASETEEWANSTVDARYQRELNHARVKKEIAPYLAKSKDRFFGSILILLSKADVEFESLADVVGKLPRAYRKPFESMGVLTIDGGEMVILDGQHRIEAMKLLITADDDKLRSMGVTSDQRASINGDEISVIFLDIENMETIRRIFNKVNRYARRVGTADAIVTSEDDGIAIITRRLMDEGAPLSARYQDTSGRRRSMLNWRSNTISAGSRQLLTISTVYNINKAILNTTEFSNMDEKSTGGVRPEEPSIQSAYELIETWWLEILKGVEAYSEMMNKDPFEGVDPELRNGNNALLFKPAGQISMFNGLILATERGMHLKTAIKRMNSVDWSATNQMWSNILLRPGGQIIIAKASNRAVAGELVAYLIGSKLPEEGVDRLKISYNEHKGNQPHEYIELPESHFIPASPLR